MEKPNGDKPDHNDYFEPYAYFARTLRLWFVAYGIGAPVALISNELLATRIVKSGCLPWVSFLFLSGVGLQVAMTIFWRTSMWYQYIASDHPEIVGTKCYRFWKRASKKYVLEMIPDLITIALFMAATIVALSAACG